MQEFENGAMPPIGDPSPADQPLDDQRKAFKASIRPAGLALLLFMLIQQFGAGIFIAIHTAIAALQEPKALNALLNPESAEAIQQATESVTINLTISMWALTAFTVLAYLVVVLPWRKISGIKEDIRTHRRMTFATGIRFTCLAVSVQLIYMLTMPLLMQLFPSLYNGLDMLDDLIADPSSVIFTSLLGPIVEELLFRGALISALKRHGKWYAILVSSILFGLFHANLAQGLFAFVMGLVLGYVALEYSIEWSITIHIFNNFVLAQLPTLLAGPSNALQAATISLLLTLTLGIAGLVFAIRRRESLAQYLRDNRIPEHQMRWTFTQGCYLALTIVCCGLALFMLLPR